MIRPLPHHPWLTGRSDCSPSPSASVTSPCPTSIATTRHSEVRDRPHMAWPWGRWLHGRRTRPHTASGRRRRRSWCAGSSAVASWSIRAAPPDGTVHRPDHVVEVWAREDLPHPVPADTRTAASRPPPAPGAPWRLRPHGAVRSGPLTAVDRGPLRHQAGRGRPRRALHHGGRRRGRSHAAGGRRGVGQRGRWRRAGAACLRAGPAGRARPVLTRAAYVDAVSPPCARRRDGVTVVASGDTLRSTCPSGRIGSCRKGIGRPGWRAARTGDAVHTDSSTLRGRSSAACCVLGHGQGPCRPACPRTAVPPPGPRAPVAAHMPEERCGIALDEDRSSVLTGCRVRVERFGGVQLAVLVPRGPCQAGSSAVGRRRTWGIRWRECPRGRPRSGRPVSSRALARGTACRGLQALRPVADAADGPHPASWVRAVSAAVRVSSGKRS